MANQIDVEKNLSLIIPLFSIFLIDVGVIAVY